MDNIINTSSIWQILSHVTMAAYYISLIYVLLNQQPLISKLWKLSKDKLGTLVLKEAHNKLKYWKAKYISDNSIIIERGNGDSFVISGRERGIIKNMVREALGEILIEEGNYIPDVSVDDTQLQVMDDNHFMQKISNLPVNRHSDNSRLLYSLNLETSKPLTRYLSKRKKYWKLLKDKRKCRKKPVIVSRTLGEKKPETEIKLESEDQNKGKSNHILTGLISDHFN